MSSASDNGAGKPPGPPKPPGAPKPPPVPRIAPAAPAVRPASPPSIAPVARPAAPTLIPSIAPVVPSVAPVVLPAAPPVPKDLASLAPTQSAALAQLAAVLDEMDYFQLLKVSHEASPAEIKKAFYRESRNYHPDRYYHLTDKASKERVNDIYKRMTEAYYVLRDDTKRRKYAADVTGPERAQKLRFNEASEVETKALAKKEQEEQIGTHPKGRAFYATAMQDMEAQRWSSAERNLKTALTYEPSNARYKEKMEEVRQKLHEEFKKSGDQFKIR